MKFGLRGAGGDVEGVRVLGAVEAVPVEGLGVWGARKVWPRRRRRRRVRGAAGTEGKGSGQEAALGRRMEGACWKGRSFVL